MQSQNAHATADPVFILRIVGLALVVGAVFAIGFGCWVTIGPSERGIMLRFGRYTQEPLDPGLHFKFPFGIDQVQKVPVQIQKRLEFGFRTKEAGRRTVYADDRDFLPESLMLTGDRNVADVKWSVLYHIRDPYEYLFKVRDVDDGPGSTFRDMTEAVMRQIVGDRTIDELLTVGRTAIQAEAKNLLQDLVDHYEAGLAIDDVILGNVNVPEAVRPSWNEVNEAQQEKEQMINEAKTEYNKEIPAARGEALKLVSIAKGYAVERVNRAKGETARFDSLFKEYEKAPEITRKRLYLETMERVLPRVGRKIIVDENVSGILPLLNLNQGGGRP